MIARMGKAAEVVSESNIMRGQIAVVCVVRSGGVCLACVSMVRCYLQYECLYK